MRALIVGLGVVAATAAHAEDMFLKSKTITVEGVADVKALGSEAKARDAAIKNAQRNAIESVIGTMIESNFTAQQKESLKGNKSEFESRVEDKVYSKSSGFIESQKVLSAKRSGNLYTVKLQATVKAASLDTELIALQEVFKLAEYPKIMVVVGERYTDGKGKQKWIENPSAVPMIEGALLERTFEMVAKDQADKLRKESLDTFGDMLGDDKRVAEVASQYGAEVAIVGSSEVKWSAYNELGQKMYYLSVIINLRAINVSTAKILASFEAVGKSTGVNEDLARVKAVKNAAPKVINELLTGIVRAWRAESKGGKRYIVTLLKVGNYRKVARPFMKAMKKVPKVEAVKELNFGGKRLELEVIFKGSKEELLDGIFDNVGEEKKFTDLDKVMDKGSSIELTL